ncbi:MAG: ribonuclease HII [Butyribacter sp.]|uniref:ribonuclease HII n=1 Tax=Butyribacter TaxID=2822463 RepID=UPI00033C66B9|nr:MAG: ribonuclease HII [Clostridium sp. CAG:12237_41]CCZ40136.1 ribonuclease HII [Clostridium sp. CAG:122]
MKSISEIKAELENADKDTRESLLELCKKDTRKGVLKLVEKYEKQKAAMVEELERLKKMHEFEDKYSEYEYIAGIDEAGRGPLAGPVVAASVILPKDCEILYLNDSKQLSAKRRDELFDEIKQKAIAYGIGIVSQGRIDDINILQATYEAMREAIGRMSEKQNPDLLLVDAVHIPDVDIKQVGIVKGDAKSVSIAAASILAKVTRDRFMVEMDKLYPEYGFASHKGYGSKFHIEAIKKYGASPIHRQTFIKNFVD